jgi:hypothetical protein
MFEKHPQGTPCAEDKLKKEKKEIAALKAIHPFK